MPPDKVQQLQAGPPAAAPLPTPPVMPQPQLPGERSTHSLSGATVPELVEKACSKQQPRRLSCSHAECSFET